MNKKYKLTNNTIEHKGKTLYRIEALKDFSNVKKWELGGFVEKESNLSQEGDCWIYNDGKVYDDGKVYNYGLVYGNGEVYDDGEVYDIGEVFGKGKVCGNGKVYDDMIIDYPIKTIKGFKYQIVFFKDQVQVGCKTFTNFKLLEKDWAYIKKYIENDLNETVLSEYKVMFELIKTFYKNPTF